MITRRQYLKPSLAAGAAMTLPGRLLGATAAPGELIMRAIPSSGELVPAVGLGSSATFAQVARGEDVSALRDVLAALVEHGSSMFDTAPSYRDSERVAGDIARELGITDGILWATKVNAAGRDGGRADPAAARGRMPDADMLRRMVAHVESLGG